MNSFMMAVGAPVHSTDRGARRKAGKNKSADVQIPPEQAPPLPHYHHVHNPHNRQDPDNFSELLEPAIDGPPSPGDIRALSKQVMNAAVIEKHQSHQTTSSGSSSLRSLASADRRPSWEHTLETFNLSRKSSGRSTSSSMPSRERPESVQIFGKTLFNRRGKLRRESSAGGGSSGSSMYSAEYPSDGALPPSARPKDSTNMPTLFSRRRVTPEETAHKKFQISEPYNFQHLTHTQRDDLPHLHRTSRTPLASDLSQLRASRPPAPTTFRGMYAEDQQHFAGVSSEALPLREEDESVGSAIEPHTRVPPPRNPARNRPSSFAPKNHSPARRLVKHPRPQDSAGRVPPPRPPRSPLLEPSFPSPPVPPPRVSSRVSMRYDGYDAPSSTLLDRPQTSSGFRYSQPFAMLPEADSPPATSHGYAASSHQPDVVYEPPCSRIVSPPPDDANWPLPCPASFPSEAHLAQVPEEDENTVLARQSRASIASNSSLRGSQSVPMLRRLSLREVQSRQRSSGASDTLGHFGVQVAQNTSEAAMVEDDVSETLARESWEDDIDYCYDHAVEADCDYAWERPSCDLIRDWDEEQPVQAGHAVSPAMLTPAQFEVPALSPASQHSAVMGQEAITPTVQTLPKSSNFSLPRTTDVAPVKPVLHLSTIPDGSDLVDHQEFHLSPSLLIPGDFQQHMAASDDASETRDFTYHAYDEPTLTMDTSMLLVQPRTSASTMASNSSNRSVFERHISTMSSGTDFTRLTMSTSSLDMDNYIPKRDTLDSDAGILDAEFAHSRAESMTTMTMPPLPEDEAACEPAPAAQRAFTRNGSEPNLIRWALEEGSRSPHQRKESVQVRRQRARTTSLSTPPPPGQYGLFPSINPRPRVA